MLYVAKTQTPIWVTYDTFYDKSELIKCVSVLISEIVYRVKLIWAKATGELIG